MNLCRIFWSSVIILFNFLVFFFYHLCSVLSAAIYYRNKLRFKTYVNISINAVGYLNLCRVRMGCRKTVNDKGIKENDFIQKQTCKKTIKTSVFPAQMKLLGSDRGWEALKGLKGKPPGVQFHHFLEMTTQSRCRISEILWEQQTIQWHKENCRTFRLFSHFSLAMAAASSLLQPFYFSYTFSFIWILSLTINFDTEDALAIYFINAFVSLVILV